MSQSISSAVGFDRPSGDPRQTRSVVVAEHGMVATSQPLAAQAGLDVLKRGGNAVDAAIAANAVLGVVEPMSCGIGGDLFVIYWDAKTQQAVRPERQRPQPATLNREVFRKQGLSTSFRRGPAVAGRCPAASPAGTICETQVRQPTAGRSLLAPAIDYAEQGFPSARSSPTTGRPPSQSCARGPTRPPRTCPTARRPRSARSSAIRDLAALVPRRSPKDGPEAFLRRADRRADRRVQRGQRRLLLAAETSRTITSDWVEPVSTNYRGYDVWELPPNGQGIAALQMLNLLEPYDLQQAGPGSPRVPAPADRGQEAGLRRPRQVLRRPGLRQAAHGRADLQAVRRAAGGQLLNAEQAATDVPAGDPKLEHGDTIYLTVVDKDRNCCSLIQSIYYGFGSQVVPGDVGLRHAEPRRLFALDDKHLNRLEPHKRPFHTIIPAMVTEDGKPWFCFGVMGGDMQPQGHVQVLVNMIDFGMNVQDAGDAARVRHYGSATPTGLPADADGGTVLVESGISDATIAELVLAATTFASAGRLRRLPGDHDRLGAWHAARRHRSPQRRLRGRLLMRSDQPRPIQVYVRGRFVPFCRLPGGRYHRWV